MRYILDTNILLRLVFVSDIQHPMVLQAIRRLRRRGHHLYILPQSLTEFWNVATHPVTARGGYGVSTIEVRGL
jgi:predicted nucleic acid-binding protein